MAVWKGTRVIRKEGAKPESVTDGVLVLDSTIRNQYSEEGFTDDVEKGIAYWYAFYPYTERGVGEPVFVEGAQFYPITWYNANGSVMAVSQAQEGLIPVFPNGTPSDPEGNGTFAGFMPALTSVTGPASYYAYYSYSGLSETIKDPWPLIHENTVNRLHSQYPLGGTKIAIFDTYGPQLMELVGRDTEYADYTNKMTGLSWLAVKLFTQAVNHDTAVSQSSSLKVSSYLNSIIASPVKFYWNEAGAENTKSTKIWIPSLAEVKKTTGSETHKADYTISNLKKGESWWTSTFSVRRTDGNYYYAINADGNQQSTSGSTSLRYAPGFCTK